MAQISAEKKELFDRLLAGKLQEGDAEKLSEWLGNSQLDSETESLILQHLSEHSEHWDSLSPQLRERLEQRLPLIFASDHRRPALVRLISRHRWVGYAASLLVLLGLGWLLLKNQLQSPQQEPQPLTQQDSSEAIEPGKEGAILTLENGSRLVLDSLGNGLLTTANGTQVLLRDGQLVYEPGSVPVDVVGYNTMSTPKGRQFKLVLPDGSKVWLNAASSIRYPTAFTGASREVEISGEAYFEVAHNREQPFQVKMDNGNRVEVLGTHFNINSYSNEERISTTLLEGSVRVTSASGTTVLLPGQQARSGGSSAIQVLAQVNLEKVMAWKNGLFDFQDASLEEVMRQLERWYDISVVYEGAVPKLEFYGRMGKDLDLETVLRGLEKSNVHFRLEPGRKLIITN